MLTYNVKRIWKGLICGLFALSLIISVPAPYAFASSSSSEARVNFSAGGGKPAPARQSVAVGEAVGRPADPEKNGYTFTGWYTDSKRTELYDFSSPVRGNITLYAGWERLPKVSFSSGGGKPAPKAQYINPGERLQELPQLTKSGYEFAGWYKDSRHTTAFLATETITENTKLYAKWNKLPKVTFSSGGGKPVPPPQSLNFGEKVIKPENPSKTGYIFTGWYTDSRKTALYDFNTPIDKPLKLYAGWTAIPVVSFSGGGKTPKQTVMPGGQAERPEEPEKNGYTFEGWYTDSKKTNQYDFGTPVTGRTTLYAKWTRNPVVSFSTKGKTVTPPKQTIKSGETVAPPVVSEPEDYALEGWYTDSSCKRRFDFSTPIDKSVTLYANWERTSTPTVSGSKS